MYSTIQMAWGKRRGKCFVKHPLVPPFLSTTKDAWVISKRQGYRRGPLFEWVGSILFSQKFERNAL
jgi:hypothetical protein